MSLRMPKMLKRRVNKSHIEFYFNYINNIAESYLMTSIIRIVKSINGVPIRLTATQWQHILKRHPKLKGFQDQILLTVEQPFRIYITPETEFEFAAIKVFPELREKGLAENLIVHYRELSKRDGFIITAFVMSDRRLKRRFKKWQTVFQS